MPSKNSNIRLVSIVLPTYNESENIVDLISEIRKQVKFPKQIIVVDDNSPDGTADLVKKYITSTMSFPRPPAALCAALRAGKRESSAGSRIPSVSLRASKSGMTKTQVQLEVRHKDRGLTNSIKRGIELARGDVVVWMDADFSMPPVLISKLISKIDEGFDVAVGSRFVKGGGFKRGKNDYFLAIILSRLMNYAIQFLLGRRFRDYTSGFAAVRSGVFRKIKLRGDYGEYFIDFIYRAFANKFRVIEVPYICLPRRYGQTKTGQNLVQYLHRGSKYMLLTFRLLVERHILRTIP